MKNSMFAVLVCCALLLARSAYPQTYYLPQVANGNYGNGSYRTTFIFFNSTDASAVVTLGLTMDNGDPLKVTIPGLGTNSTFTYNLAAGASQVLQTDGSGSVVVGGATVTATANIGVSAIFTIYDANGDFLTESGVGSSQPLVNFAIPVEATGNSNTGLALFGSSSSTATMTLILRNASGQEAGKTSKSLDSNAHLAVFVAGPGQLFPTVSNFRGTLEVQSSTPISALALRQNSAPLSFTSLPVAATGRIPDLRGKWQGEATGYAFSNVLSPTDFPQYVESSTDEDLNLEIDVQTGRAFAGSWREGRDKLTGVILPDGTIRIQTATEGGDLRSFSTCTLSVEEGKYVMTGTGDMFDDLFPASDATMATGFVRFVKLN